MAVTGDELDGGTLRVGQASPAFPLMAWQIPCLCTAQLLAYTKPLPFFISTSVSILFQRQTMGKIVPYEQSYIVWTA